MAPANISGAAVRSPSPATTLKSTKAASSAGITREEVLARLAEVDKELMYICQHESEVLASSIRSRAHATGNELRAVSLRMGWKSEAIQCLLLAARTVHSADPGRSGELAKLAHAEAKSAGLVWEQYEADRIMSTAAYCAGDIATAKRLCSRALEKFRSLGDNRREVACIWTFRNIEYSLGRLDREIILLSSLIDHPGIHEIQHLDYLVHTGLARVLTDFRADDPRIPEHIAIADRLTAASPNPLSRCSYYDARVNHMVDNGEYEEALPLALEFREHARRHNSIVGETTALSHLADCYDGLRDDLMFRESLEESLRLGRLIDHKGAISCCLSSRGEMNFQTDPESARRDVEEALETAKAARLVALEQRCTRLLATNLESIGDYEAAVTHLHRYIELQEEVRTSAYEHAMRSIDLQHRVATTEDAIEQLYEKSDTLQHELERQASEAAAKAAALVEQANVVRNVHTIMQQVFARDSSPSEIIAELRRRFEDIPLPELQWQQLSDEFTRMFPDFLTNLRKRCPTITKTEERVCCLVRLNLSTRDMAALLNITERGVETCRYRIRRRAQLTNRTSLQEYLAAI